MRKKIHIITMGCSKNLVDSERLMRQLAAAGYQVKHEGPVGKVFCVIINTCGFIHDAREESVNMILECVEARKKGRIELLYVMGCLSQRYREELLSEIPEVDQYFGARDIREVLEALQLHAREDLMGERVLTTPAHYSYLKIAEGCDRTCAFCSIPLIRGPHVSRPLEEITSEARYLASQGVKELLVISQDITYYGYDLYRKSALAELIRQLCRIEGPHWVRLHYTYPRNFPLEVLDLMNSEPKLCHYLDIPVQHISDPVLQAMRRNITREQTLQLLREIRRRVPGIALRTTLLVGHPGETEDDFRQLLDFVQEMRFERLGVFTYSHEEGTHAGLNYRDDIPSDVKAERAARIMELQRAISEDHNQRRVGSVFRVLIDRQEGDFFVGRTQYDSPEVDNEVLIPVDPCARVGSFCDVRITSATEYDLFGALVS